MLNTVKIVFILLVFTLLMPLGSTLSYAWDHGHEGHFGGHGFGGHRHDNFGVVFNYSPYYNPYYYPYYYDPGILVSPPVVETPEIVEQPSTTVVTTAPNYPPTEITPAQINTTDTDNEFTINIPNSKRGIYECFT